MIRLRSNFVVFLLCAMLAACGGGGGGGSSSDTSSTPPPSNGGGSGNDNSGNDNDDDSGSEEPTPEEKYHDAVLALRENVNSPGAFSYDLLNAVSIDLDNDDDMDLVLAGSKNNWRDKAEVVIFRNINNEDFVREDTNINASFRAVSVADFNGDGLNDLFMGDHGLDDHPWPGAQDQLLLQTADGKLDDVTSTNLPTEDTYTHSACAMRLNADGMYDVYQGILGYPQMLQNNGDGSMSEVAMPDMDYATEDHSEIRGLTFPWCAVADVDSDSDDDLILGNGNVHDTVDAAGNPVGRAHVILFNEGGSLTYRGAASQVASQGSQFVPMTEDDAGVTISILTNDFNQDNCADFVALETNYTSEATIEVFVNDCAGNFTSVQLIEGVDTDVYHLRAVDMNDDGVLDIVAANYLPKGWYGDFSELGYRVLLNNGDSTFESRAPAAADIDKLPLELAAFWYAN